MAGAASHEGHNLLKEDGAGRFSALALAALGIVFGDIGTSPLYAIQECFAHGLPVTPPNIMGVISLIFWSVTIVVSLKYVFVVMRAGNKGEGGILALTALALSGTRRQRGVGAKTVTIIGLCGAALFFGDSAITPAISVLSAIEGLEVAAPHVQDIILPLSCTILIMLFWFQRYGTQHVGSYFGPLMILWFGALAIMGLRHIIAEPAILNAVNPLYAIHLAGTHGMMAMTVLGAVLLAFTGAEALYADMGHFGKGPVRWMWFCLVMPALLLNYFGQGALLLATPAAASNPFYHLVPQGFTLALVILASLATIVASQAVISGAFSMAQQAMHLDCVPRFRVLHTSEEVGQIYVPQVNWILCAAVVTLIVLFRGSGALADAYGFAVSGTMVATSLLVFSVARNVWRWRLISAVALVCPFLAVDMVFFSTAVIKIHDGAWLPLVIGIAIMIVFMTWRQGRSILKANRRQKGRKTEAVLKEIIGRNPYRVTGTAVYLFSIAGIAPPALVSNLRHNKVLHERVLLLAVQTEEDPRVPEEDRATVEALGEDVWQVVLHYGFMERPDVVNDLQTYLLADCPIDIQDTSFFIGHDIFVEGDRALKPRWRERLFLWLSNHAADAFEYFRIPTERVVKLGVQVKV